MAGPLTKRQLWLLAVGAAALVPGSVGFDFKTNPAVELCRFANDSNYDASRGLTVSTNTDFLTTFNITPSPSPSEAGRITSNSSRVDLTGDGFSVAVDVKVPSSDTSNITLMKFVVRSSIIMEIVLTPDADVIHFRLINLGKTYAFTAPTRDGLVSDNTNWQRTQTSDWFRITLSFVFSFSDPSVHPEVELVVSDGELGGLEMSPPVFPNVVKRARLDNFGSRFLSTDLGVTAFRQACYDASVGGATAACTTALQLGIGLPVAGCVRAVNVSRNQITYEREVPFTTPSTFGVRCTCPDGGSYVVRGGDSACSSHQCIGGTVDTAVGSCVSKGPADLPDNWQTVVCAPDAEVNVYRNSLTDPDSLEWRTNISNAGFDLVHVRPGGDRSNSFGFNAGLCTCPNGMVYLVGDLFDGCTSVACFGGVSSRTSPQCLSNTGPSAERERTNHGVVCGALASRAPTLAPTAVPTVVPTFAPTLAPGTRPPTTPSPTATPTLVPTARPTASPTDLPTATPSTNPTAHPTGAPTASPTAAPTTSPTSAPTAPTAVPTANPTAAPTAVPTVFPTAAPSAAPSETPTAAPTDTPTTGSPTAVAAAGSDGGGGGDLIIIIVIVVAVLLLLFIIVLVVKRKRRDKTPGQMTPGKLSKDFGRSTTPMEPCEAHASNGNHGKPPNVAWTGDYATVGATTGAQSGEITYGNPNHVENDYGEIAISDTYASVDKPKKNAGEEMYADLQFSRSEKKRGPVKDEDDTVIYTVPTVAQKRSSVEDNYAAVEFIGGNSPTTKPVPRDSEDVVYSTVDTGQGRSVAHKIVVESTGV
eukprot:m.135469 g.135469  ORF g.135469 m.135469 type:complete len:814 (+) comp13906_c0_seq2:186-2627(+)